LLRQQRAKVAEQALALGRDYDHKADLVFPGVAGMPLRPSKFSAWLTKIRDKAGLPKDVQPAHSWRHTHASELIAAGLDAAAVSKRLGHASVTTTLSRYVHPGKEQDELAAKIGEAKLRR
jgi:integrase